MMSAHLPRPKPLALLRQLVLAAAAMAPLLATAGEPAKPPENSPALVTLGMRDGTEVSGELVSFSRGYFVLRVRKGRLTIAAERVKTLTPIDALPPKPERRMLSALRGREEEYTKRRLANRERQFASGFERMDLPQTHFWAFKEIAMITRDSVLLRDMDRPFQVIDKARQTPGGKTPRGQSLLHACEAMAANILGQRERAKKAMDAIPDGRFGRSIKMQLNRFAP